MEILHLREGAATEDGEIFDAYGLELEAGDQAPELYFTRQDGPFELVITHLLSELRGKVVLISFVNAVSTPVCYNETRFLKEAAGELNTNQAVVLTLSQEPTAFLAGWENLLTAEMGGTNCHRLGSLENYPKGLEGYGVKIKQWDNMPQRALFVLNTEGKIVFTRYVYDQGSAEEAEEATAWALEALRKELETPA